MHCLISSFYIKPQPIVHACNLIVHCLISSFYIKPQPSRSITFVVSIVLYRLSTSNHNLNSVKSTKNALSYIVFLHQTTTITAWGFSLTILSYIVFLHQTTTGWLWWCVLRHCLISSFYIKPQPQDSQSICNIIVLYRLSTSNHNIPHIFYWFTISFITYKAIIMKWWAYFVCKNTKKIPIAMELDELFSQPHPKY